MKKLKTDISYVIYVRKSTDEGSKETPTIAEQINQCVEYAKANNLKIMAKPERFSFETRKDLVQEDATEDSKIFQETRHLYIVKEKASAKTPGRPKWNKLMRKVMDGEIGGIISCSPDRQTRNLQDAGLLLECVNEDLVNLKYSAYKSEPMHDGLLTLGLYLLFYIYEQKRFSESVKRGLRKNMERREG